MQTNTCRVTLFWATILLLVHPGTGADATQDTEPILGKLNLEGQSITRLVLKHKETGQREVFRRPEQSIELPVGHYSVQEVHLEGGYTSGLQRDTKHYLVSATSDDPVTLKLGGPLKPTVSIDRQGRQLVMTYALLGVGGQQYTGGNPLNPPTFTAYRGDKAIASDSFEYG